MSDQGPDRVTSAATAVMKALEPLSSDERSRVIQSAAALYGLEAPKARAGTGSVDASLSKHDEPAGEVDDHGKRLSIVELLRQKQPATNSQRIAVFAFYREHVEKKSKFARGDLEQYFASAKLAKPGNYDRDFAGAIREGWVHEDGGDSYLTQGGEDAVNEGFAGKGKPRGVSVSGKRKPNSGRK